MQNEQVSTGTYKGRLDLEHPLRKLELVIDDSAKCNDDSSDRHTVMFCLTAHGSNPLFRRAAEFLWR